VRALWEVTSTLMSSSDRSAQSTATLQPSPSLRVFLWFFIAFAAPVAYLRLSWSPDHLQKSESVAMGAFEKEPLVP
jgi:hypothetical protein